MRAIWSGSTGFGLINIPVKLFSATESSMLDLDMLDRRDHSRIRFQRINENTGKVVEWDSMYFDTPYYVVPDKGGQKPYSLLLKALEKSGKAGVGLLL